MALAVVLLVAVAAQGGHGPVGAVYTMSNAVGGNEVYAFDRYADGHLEFSAAYETGGLGTGAGLGNQGGVVLSDNHRWLLAVNAGSDELSLFRVARNGLTLADVVSSHGRMPVSVAIRGDLVYVVNAGGSVGASDGIAGFRLTSKGNLEFLAGSIRPLSATSTGPAQIGISRDAKLLVVTEKATNVIDTFLLDRDGYADGHVVNESEGDTPFSFAFVRGKLLVVSEVFGGASDAGAASSYRIGKEGALEVISDSVPNTETAPCWLVAGPGGRFVFTTNTPDDSLSAYVVDGQGTLSLRDADGRTGEPGNGTRPLDMDLSGNGRFLYTLNIGNDTISTFAVGADGSLSHLGMIAGAPETANGLAAR
jgi:6-phosphogluconolactonase (cycloisomerase 2 family)